MNTILTDDERRAAANAAGPFVADQNLAVEAAVLAKLREQEPVAYGMPDTQLGRKHRLMMVRLDKGQDGCTLPLYAAPLPAVVQVPPVYQARQDNDCAYAFQDGWNACRKTMLAAAPEAPAAAVVQVPQGDEDAALDFLAELFDAYENGPACYEDPDDCSGFLGNAVRMDSDTFHAIADLLNRRRPASNAAAPEAPAQEKSNG